MRFRRIACVQLDSRLPDFCSKVVMPRYGLPVIGTVLQEAGYEVKVFIEHCAQPDEDWIVGADMVLFSALTGAATKTYEMVDRLRRRTKAPFVIGGEHASSFTEDTLDWFDYVIRREGDALILELVKALEEGRPVEQIPGLSYRTPGGITVHNPPGQVPKELETGYDINIIHGYPKEDGVKLFLKRGQSKLICVQSTRGCPYQCNFCVTPRLFGFTYRFREVEAVIDDIKAKLPYGREFMFVDNLFALNKPRTNVLLDRMIEEGIGEKAAITCFCRVEIGKQPEMLAKMYKAGIRTICQGLESIDDTTLDNIDKSQTVADTVRSIRAIRDAGIFVSGSFIAGNDGDTRESLMKTVDFVIEHGLHSFYYISLWYYPGDPRSPLIPQRQIMPSLDYLTGHFVTHFPSKLKPSTLQRTLVDAQRKFWGLKRAAQCFGRGEFEKAAHIAMHRYAFRDVEKAQLEYASYLESIEHGYYDANERLIMDRIVKRELDPLVARCAKSGVVKLDTEAARRPMPNMDKLEKGVASEVVAAGLSGSGCGIGNNANAEVQPDVRS